MPDNGVLPFGDASDHGSMAGQTVDAPIVGIAATPDGGGYWETDSGGGVYSFGDAGFYGSMGGRPLSSSVVGMAASPDGRGYWEVAADGGIFSFGDAGFHGSAAGRHPGVPITGMATNRDGGGYWEVGADGGVFAFGNAPFEGSGASSEPQAPVVGIASTPGNGYWEAAGGSDLGIFEVTCYDLPGRTATGQPVSTAGAATDPSVIPLGTQMEVAGAGFRVADDTGGDVKGRRVDVWEPSASQCDQWGVQDQRVWTLP